MVSLGHGAVEREECAQDVAEFAGRLGHRVVPGGRHQGEVSGVQGDKSEIEGDNSGIQEGETRKPGSHQMSRSLDNSLGLEMAPIMSSLERPSAVSVLSSRSGSSRTWRGVNI